MWSDDPLGTCFAQATMSESASLAMNPADAGVAVPTPAAPTPADPRRLGEGWVLTLITLMVLGAWGVTRMGLYTTKSDLAYWLGVVGGVGMLLLLSYPLRKHVRFMHRWGAAKGWFVVHMVLGVAGPVLILLHSNFEIGSLNAGVAFFSMVIVALSGVVGRFLYLRVHRSLSGEKLGLGQLRDKLDAEHTAAARLRFAPRVVAQCRAFETLALERRIVTGGEVIRAMFVLPWHRWRTARASHAELRRRLVKVAHAEGWTRRKLHSRLRAASLLVDEYLLGAQRVALFTAWSRVFSWWHVAHVPFVYLLVISAIVHVIAVHAY
jgi:hypothetical protein